MFADSREHAAMPAGQAHEPAAPFSLRARMALGSPAGEAGGRLGASGLTERRAVLRAYCVLPCDGSPMEPATSEFKKKKKGEGFGVGGDSKPFLHILLTVHFI